MGYFDGIVEQHFSKEGQQTIFYPWGSYGYFRRGRIIENIDQELIIRKGVKRFAIINFAAVMVAIVVGNIFGSIYFDLQQPFNHFNGAVGIWLVGLISLLGVLLFWVHFLRASGVFRLLVSNKRYGLSERLSNSALHLGAPTTSILLVLSVLMLCGSLLALIIIISLSSNWLDITIVFLCVVIFALLAWAYIYMLSKISKNKV